MSTAKKIGIWMDHKCAHLMEFTADTIETNMIESKFTHDAKGESLDKSENIMHNKEQHQRSEYYKMLGEKIRRYESVLLFGPTEAKTELFNILKADHLFAKIKIDIRQTDKMTEKQEHAFVRNFFSPN